MRIKLIAVGHRMPKWVMDGWCEYTKRLPPEIKLELVEIPLQTRGKNADINRLIAQEGMVMLNKAPSNSRVVTLEVTGKALSTEQLAQRLSHWQLEGQDVCLMIGGPEGLAPEVCARSDEKWSLSALTFPHPLVRIIIAEQLYRAWSLLAGHPYHK